MENRRVEVRNVCESGVFVRGECGNLKREAGTAVAVVVVMDEKES